MKSPQPPRVPLNRIIDSRAKKPVFESSGESVVISPLVLELLERSVDSFKPTETATFNPASALTHVAFILDSSGSMNHGKEATIEGFNAQLQVVKQGAELAGRTLFTEVHFDNEVKTRTWVEDLSVQADEALLAMTAESYQPRGGTALYDALGSTIARLLATPEISAPSTAVLVTLFTDGHENASQAYDAGVLKKLVERLEATQRWTFALVGPQNTISGLAELLSVKRKNITGFDVHSVSDKRKAFEKTSVASAKYMALRAQGATSCDELYDDMPLPPT